MRLKSSGGWPQGRQMPDRRAAQNLLMPRPRWKVCKCHAVAQMERGVGAVGFDWCIGKWGVSHFLITKVTPEWRLNPGFGTQKKCPFNRGNKYTGSGRSVWITNHGLNFCTFTNHVINHAIKWRTDQVHQWLLDGCWTTIGKGWSEITPTRVRRKQKVWWSNWRFSAYFWQLQR